MHIDQNSYQKLNPGIVKMHDSLFWHLGVITTFDPFPWGDLAWMWWQRGRKSGGVGEQESLSLDLSVLAHKVNTSMLNSAPTPSPTGAVKVLGRIQTLQDIVLSQLQGCCLSWLPGGSLSRGGNSCIPTHHFFFLSSHKPVDNRMAFLWLQWAPKRSSSYSGILAGQSCHPVVAESVLAEMISHIRCNKHNWKAVGILQSQKEPSLPIPQPILVKVAGWPYAFLWAFVAMQGMERTFHG